MEMNTDSSTYSNRRRVLFMLFVFSPSNMRLHNNNINSIICLHVLLPPSPTWKPMALIDMGKLEMFTPIFIHCKQKGGIT